MNRILNLLVLTLGLSMISSLAMAQTTKTKTRTTRRGGTLTRTVSTDGNGTVQVNGQGTNADGKTAGRAATYDLNASDGAVGRSKVLTGPQGKTRTVDAGTTNNGDGTATHTRDFKGFGDRTASRTVTAGNGSRSVSGTRRSGATYSRSHRRP